jgi:hypothetical protein
VRVRRYGDPTTVAQQLQRYLGSGEGFSRAGRPLNEEIAFVETHNRSRRGGARRFVGLLQRRTKRPAFQLRGTPFQEVHKRGIRSDGTGGKAKWLPKPALKAMKAEPRRQYALESNKV